MVHFSLSHLCQTSSLIIEPRQMVLFCANECMCFGLMEDLPQQQVSKQTNQTMTTLYGGDNCLDISMSVSEISLSCIITLMLQLPQSSDSLLHQTPQTPLPRLLSGDKHTHLLSQPQTFAPSQSHCNMIKSFLQCHLFSSVHLLYSQLSLYLCALLSIDSADQLCIHSSRAERQHPI